ncbi:MAG TPA: methyl-accepting chemotaxis protein [Albitalea sp.]|nr:methyl-accepting chemotaxis protein [Albitalea sp.]
MNLNNLKIGVRLSLGFGLVLALLALIVATSFARLVQTQSGMEEVVQYERRASLVDEWLDKTQMNANRTIAIAKSTGLPEVINYFSPLIVKTSAEISELQKQLEAGVVGDKGKALLATIADKRKAYVETRDKMNELIKAADQPAVEALVKEKLLPAIDVYLAAMTELKTYEDAQARQRAEAVASETSTAKTLLITLMAISLGVGVFGAVTITRSVTRPLQEAVAAAHIIADNDLSHQLDSQRKDELGELLRGLGKMQSALRKMVSQVRLSTDGISNASAEIASGNQDLSSRTEQAAANLQQAASSMEELTGTVKQSADSARQANQLAASAAEVAARGGDVVSKVVSTMDDINASSKKIADIIGVIDGIAFQTNILALNAAVEAARAGEQGRGFAVVAGEVRNLAQRSAQAAKEIKGLIGASVDKVESGSKLVADAGKTMQEIVGSVQRVTDIIGEITAAASEQSDGIGQVNTAVTQLDQMTQQNAALVEQSAAAAESLKQQAVRLAAVVGTFRLDQGAPGQPAASLMPRVSAAVPAVAAPARKQPAAPAAVTSPQPAPAAIATPAAAPSTSAPAASVATVAKPVADDDWETF